MSDEPAAAGPPPDQGSGTLGLAALLAFLAGFVDAHIYLHVVDVFVANMSGNLIRLGMATGLASWHEVWRSAASIAAFVGGVALGTRLNRVEFRATHFGRSRLLLTIEASLMVCVLVVLVLPVGGAGRPWPVVLCIVCSAAVAMGIQAAVLGRVGNVVVTTTYGTGSLVRIAQPLVRPSTDTTPESTTRTRVIAVLVAVLGSYVTGAVVSARAGGSPWLMVVPALGLGGAALMVGPLTRPAET